MDKIKSLMFVPAKDKMLSKIEVLEADAFIIDLEDSIEEEKKLHALESTITYLEQRTNKQRIFVRVNIGHMLTELSVLDRFVEIGFMIPKCETVINCDVAVEDILQRHKTIALVETPRGVVNIQEIASCNWVDAIAFGAEDYTAATNMKNSSDYLVYQKSRLVTYAKAYGKKIYDTPCFMLNDEEMLTREVKLSVELGFDGKLIISPKHIAAVKRGFAGKDLDAMRNIIQEYETRGDAVAVIDGKVYEKMHIDRMKRVLRENGGN